ncbi:amidase family protein [Flavobacteriaceae bacterium S356]|uniref:Amidase family protein n=1 Tax=Asprobacillus argus TaxID=3076534 RepID=A0ABU3LHB3_9FLAO|nr:amidase family protein [Flavobacteriaceae bacterium S356]
MKRILFFIVSASLLLSCKKKEAPVVFKKYDETALLKKQQEHERSRMQFKLFQPKALDMNTVFKPFENDLAYFSEADYDALKPLIIEQNIPTLQKHVNDGKLTYEKLTLFYLYRIRKYESDSTTSLNAIIALNPNVLKQARKRDKNRKDHSNTDISIYGMPILLKDNINTAGMPTTAGALALRENVTTDDAFIVKRLKENGALILGKVNLSEWAYFFCSGCPLGYSAIGGQSLNPYGRGKFETGGSSASSGTAVAANYAVAAIGTETAGSITSPSSQNSVVGLKPTIGLLSRTGIVPISSTLDTPGPMTKSIIDNMILLEAMVGYDANDKKSYKVDGEPNTDFTETIVGKRFGVFPSLLQDSVYKANVEIIKKAGGDIVELAPVQIGLPGFLTLLNIDMKHDLPEYLKNHTDKNVTITSVEDVINFNEKDSLLRAPYGQQLFEGIVADTTTLEQLQTIKKTLMDNARTYFKPLDSENLDAILSINNYHAGYSAVAEYPNLTVPMGYKKSGEPISLTFIVMPKKEGELYVLGAAFENLTKHRKLPGNYE